MVADATKDVSLVDLLDMDDLELESIDTTIASVAGSALMKEAPTRFSTPKCPRPLTSESSTPPTPSTSTSTATPFQPPAKKLKLNLGLSRPQPKILLSMSQVIHKIMNSSLSGSSSACVTVVVIRTEAHTIIKTIECENNNLLLFPVVVSLFI